MTNCFSLIFWSDPDTIWSAGGSSTAGSRPLPSGKSQNLNTAALDLVEFTFFFLQAAYIAKLHQQAASIKNLLKLLNAGENNPGDLTTLPNIGSFENVSESSSNNNVNLNFANFAQSGPEVNPEESVYESLWETGSLLKPRVNEVEELGEEEGRTSQVEEVRTFIDLGALQRPNDLHFHIAHWECMQIDVDWCWHDNAIF